MNQICRHLADAVDVTYGTRVSRLEREGDTWLLVDDNENELGHFDRVIVTAPPTQAAALVRDAAPDLLTDIGDVDMLPCWAVMAAFEAPLETDFDGVFVNDGPLDWVARNASKPGRDATVDTWVLHASPEWTEAHIEADSDGVVVELIEAFFRALGLEARPAAWTTAHRWRYAKAKASLEVGCLYDPDMGIGACGDWTAGNRIEGAFFAGMSAAGRILGSVSADEPQPQLELI
jgi:hypothetical protein